MATILHLSNEVICIILSSNSISVQDFVNFSCTCKRFRDVIKDNNTFWQQKFRQRWPDLMKICEKEMSKGYIFMKDFEELLKARTKYKKTLRQCLTEISKKNYQNYDDYEPLKENILVSCKEFYKKEIYVDEDDLNLLFHPNRTIHTFLDYYFFLDELSSFIDFSKSEHKDDLTNIYYGKKLFMFLNHYYLKNVWQKFINRPAEKQLVEEVIIFIRQWFLPARISGCTISYLFVERSLDKIVRKVMKRLKKKHSMHPILSVSHKQFLFWQCNNIYENQWYYNDGIQILYTIDDILSKFLHEIRHDEKPTFVEECYHIIKNCEDQVINMHSDRMLQILFQSIARRLGICCKLITADTFTIDSFPNNFHLIWEPKYDVTKFNDKRCFPVYKLFWKWKQYSYMLDNTESLKIEKGSIITCSSSHLRVDTRMLAGALAEPMGAGYFEKIYKNPYNFTVEFLIFDNFILWLNFITLKLQHLVIPNNLKTWYLGSFYESRIKHLSLQEFIITSKELICNSNYCTVVDHIEAKNTLRKVTHIHKTQKNLAAERQYQFENREPKRRKARIKFAVGMIVTICNYKNKIGVICGWIEEDYDIKPPLDIKPYPLYFVLFEGGIYRAFEDELCKLDMPGPIKNPEIGKFFSEYRGTYYMPNEALAKEYPEDVLYLYNEL